MGASTRKPKEPLSFSKESMVWGLMELLELGLGQFYMSATEGWSSSSRNSLSPVARAFASVGTDFDDCLHFSRHFLQPKPNFDAFLCPSGHLLQPVGKISILFSRRTYNRLSTDLCNTSLIQPASPKCNCTIRFYDFAVCALCTDRHLLESAFGFAEEPNRQVVRWE